LHKIKVTIYYTCSAQQVQRYNKLRKKIYSFPFQRNYAPDYPLQTLAALVYFLTTYRWSNIGLAATNSLRVGLLKIAGHFYFTRHDFKGRYQVNPKTLYLP